MEDGLRQFVRVAQGELERSLNPCFCGRWSATYIEQGIQLPEVLGLNPCFCGRWSATDTLVGDTML